MKQQGNNLRKDTKKSKQQNEEQRGHVPRFFYPVYFHFSNPSGAVIHMLKYFRIQLRFRNDTAELDSPVS